jgi:hypothetical protein
LECEQSLDPIFGNVCDLEDIEIIKNMTNLAVDFSIFTPVSLEVVQPNEINFLRIRDSKLDFIPPDFFNKFPSIKTLEIFNSQLKSINRETFKKAANLKVLNLEKNLLRKLDDKVFASLVNLEELNLSNNNLESIHPKAFDKLKNLKKLELSRCSCINESFQIVDFDQSYLKQKLETCYKNYNKNYPDDSSEESDSESDESPDIISVMTESLEWANIVKSVKEYEELEPESSEDEETLLKSDISSNLEILLNLEIIILISIIAIMAVGLSILLLKCKNKLTKKIEIKL